MKNFLKALVVLLSLNSAAHAQSGNLQSGQIWGNPSGGAAKATGTTIAAILNLQAGCNAQGDIYTRGASAWACLAPGTVGLPLVSGGAGADLAYTRLTNAGLATGGAATFKGNPTNATATVTDFTIQGLTARGAPDASNDKIPIFDNAAGTIKYVTPAQVAAAATAGVSSLGGQTGAITLSGLTMVGSVLTNSGTGVSSIAGNAGAFTLNATKGLTNATNSLQTTFTQTGSGAVATDLVARTKLLPVSPWDFTSATIDDGTTDAGPAIRLAIATGKDVYLPKPTTCYKVNDDLIFSISFPGQEIFGDGRGINTICVKANSFTNGLFVCNGAQPGNTFRDMKISYLQPNPTPAASFNGSISGNTLTIVSGLSGTIAIGQQVGNIGVVANGTTITAGSGTSWTVSGLPQTVSTTAMFSYTLAAMRAQLTAYKPVWACPNSPRVQIRHMAVAGAYDGADFHGNSGGLDVDDLQMSSLNSYGIYIDGALDSVRIKSFHYWPFDLPSNVPLIMYQAPISGLYIGRVDGIMISEYLNFSARAATIFDSGLGVCQCFISNSYLDSFNGIVQSAGNLNVSNTALTLGGDLTGNAYVGLGTGTKAEFTGVEVLGGSSVSPFQLQNGSGLELIINGCIGDIGQISGYFISVASTALASNVQVSGCRMSMNTNTTSGFLLAQIPGSGTTNTIHAFNNIIRSTGGVAYANPIFSIFSGNRATLIGNRIDDKGAGAGTFISKSADNYDYIVGNTAPGWTLSLPAAVVGVYSPNPH